MVTQTAVLLLLASVSHVTACFGNGIQWKASGFARNFDHVIWDGDDTDLYFRCGYRGGDATTPIDQIPGYAPYFQCLVYDGPNKIWPLFNIDYSDGDSPNRCNNPLPFKCCGDNNQQTECPTGRYVIYYTHPQAYGDTGYFMAYAAPPGPPTEHFTSITQWTSYPGAPHQSEMQNDTVTWTSLCPPSPPAVPLPAAPAPPISPPPPSTCDVWQGSGFIIHSSVKSYLFRCGPYAYSGTDINTCMLFTVNGQLSGGPSGDGMVYTDADYENRCYRGCGSNFPAGRLVIHDYVSAYDYTYASVPVSADTPFYSVTEWTSPYSSTDFTVTWTPMCPPAPPSSPPLTPPPVAPPSSPPNPPPPPLTPPPPSFPRAVAPPTSPLTVGEILRDELSSVISVTFTLGGSLDDFTSAARTSFENALKEQLDCHLPQCHIVLRFSAGSVVVETDIVMPTAHAGASPAVTLSQVSALTSQPTATLSEQLGVTVQSSSTPVQAPTPQVVSLVMAPTPPSPSPPPPSPSPTCQSVCRSYSNGASPFLMGNGCYKWDGNCVPYHGRCDSDRQVCLSLDASTSVDQNGGCIDEWSSSKPRKCARKLRKNKCHKRRVMAKCLRTCGIC